MAVGTLIVCPHCGNGFSRQARENFCSDHCRFWHKVKVSSHDDCWLWTGAAPSFGHGQFCFNGSRIYAHRFAWEKANGRVPHGLCVLHKCDVPACVNPQHLFLGTREENLADMRSKGRGSNPPRFTGSSHHRAKITEEIVRLIRASADDQLTLAKRYGISRRNVNRIVNRKIWVGVK